jgi:DNA-directed RNA polymerase subunit F
MATTLRKEEILKAAQTMSKEERLKLIADIAALPDEVGESAIIHASETENVDEEVMKAARQLMNRYSNLLRRLAE